jgi:penicillin-binding protein 2
MKQYLPLKNVQEEKRLFRSRIFIAIGLVLLCFGTLIARYIYLQIFHYQEFQTASDNNRIRLQPLPPARGYIYDRNGILLADNYPVFTATMSKADVEDIDGTVKKLIPILDLTQDDIDRFNSRIKTAKKLNGSH